MLSQFTHSLPNKPATHNDTLKIIAIIAMVIDHIGLVFFDDDDAFRIIGRIAFPIFAYQLAQGYIYTSNRKKYMMRIYWFALLSQIPYTLLFETFSLNILFTLLLALLLIDKIHHQKYYYLPFFIFVAYIIPIDYGIYGILTPLSFYLFSSLKVKALLSQVILTTIQSVWLNPWNLQWFALIGVILCLYLPKEKWSIHLNKYFFYWFYPVHLVTLLIIKIFLFL